MKTDLIEIFQTIRAVMQAYETFGFSNRVNTDTEYDLWSEKNVTIDGEEKSDLFFSSVKIVAGHVTFCFELKTEMGGFFNSDLLNSQQEFSCVKITQLDHILIDQIKNALAKGHDIYKRKEWL